MVNPEGRWNERIRSPKIFMEGKWIWIPSISFYVANIYEWLHFYKDILVSLSYYHLQHFGLRKIIATVGTCTSGRSLFGVSIRISVAFLAFPQECLRFLQVPRLGKYSWIPNKWYIEKAYHIHCKLINPYLTNLYFRHSQYSSFALHWPAIWFVSSLYRSIGCFLLPVPTFGFNMCGIPVRLS